MAVIGTREPRTLANRYPPGEPRPAWRRIVVVVEAARPDRVHVRGLAALPRQQQSDGVDLWTVVVLGMGIRRHVVRARVDMDSGLLIETLAQALCYSSEDKVEGTTAFLEKRKPKFSGR